MNNTSPSHGWAWFWVAVSALYTILPIDIVPDFIPIAGQADDILSIGTAALNLIQSYTAKSNAALSSIVKTLKYLLLVGGFIVVLVLVLIALLVYKVAF